MSYKYKEKAFFLNVVATTMSACARPFCIALQTQSEM